EEITIEGTAADPSREVIRLEDAEGLRQAITQLDVEHREVVLLIYFEGSTYQEVATLLEVPIGTVYSRAHHARNKLRKWLDDRER
ncbi:MAG: sigma-70 family RNA polymerase sigma factor, partial [Planctomycetaceae bacterium]|nr:sigma-70 family RNA polymerase sigma factor [Planctomycetaceae bacterium]